MSERVTLARITANLKAFGDADNVQLIRIALYAKPHTTTFNKHFSYTNTVHVLNLYHAHNIIRETPERGYVQLRI